MKKAHELHEKAMARIDQALIARGRGNRALYQRNLREALQLERDAALRVATSDLQPSRSVLLRSAAALAVDNGELEEARRLANLGLQGDPPAEIADELREILRKVKAERAKFKKLYPTICQFFLNCGFPRHEVSRLTQITFRTLYRELRSISLVSVLEEACRVAWKQRRTQRDRAGIRDVAASHSLERADPTAVESEREIELPEPLRRTFEELSDDVRRCFLMRMNKLSYRVIAGALKVPIESAKSLSDEAILQFSNLAVPGFQDLVAFNEGGNVELESTSAREAMIGGAGRQRG